MYDKLVKWVKGEESDATLLEIVSMLATSVDSDVREVFNVQLDPEEPENDTAVNYDVAWRLLELYLVMINEKLCVENFM